MGPPSLKLRRVKVIEEKLVGGFEAVEAVEFVVE